MKRAVILFSAAILLGNCTQYNLASRFNDAYAGEFGLQIISMGGFAQGNLGVLIPSDPSGAGGGCSGDVIDIANCFCKNYVSLYYPKKGGKTFRAWLSTSSVDAVCNVQGLKERGCGVKSFSIAPYRSYDFSCFGGGDQCFPVAAKDLSALISGKLNVAPILPFGAGLFWTGTNPDGTYAGAAATCNDWTSVSAADIPVKGMAGTTDATWTLGGTPTGDCSAGGGQLYCFEQP